MTKTTRRLAALAGCAFLLTATGCHYDYGYYNVGYSYGYDCAPRYYNYNCDYTYASHSYYRAPCDGVRFRTGVHYGHTHFRRGHCD